MTKTKEIQELLRRKLLISTSDDDANLFSGGIFLTEVTHIEKRSRADVLFIGMTNQSGRRMDGYEIKVSRGDWLRELRSPTKADAWADECQSWTIVADEGVVKPDELPDGFGLLERRERKTIRLVQVAKPRVSDRMPSWNAMFSVFSAMDRDKRKRISESTEELSKRLSECNMELAREKRRQSISSKNERAENILKVLENEFGYIRDPQDRETFRGMSVTAVIQKMRPFLLGESKISNVVGNNFHGLIPTAQRLAKELEKMKGVLEEIEQRADTLKDQTIKG